VQFLLILVVFLGEWVSQIPVAVFTYDLRKAS
jgi:hypothetical protein